MKGKRIIVTRAPHQATELGKLLCSRGAEPLFYPCITIAPPENVAPLDAALQAAVADDFDWLVVTSTNAVLVLAKRLEELRLAPANLSNIAIAAVGPATAEAVQNLLGLQVTVVPDKYVAESLAAALRSTSPAHMLVLQADIARPTLAQELITAGAKVTAVAAYRTVQGRGGINLAAMLADSQIDAITFTSSSTVRNCMRRLEAEGGNPSHLAGICLACIGPVTAQSVQDLGFSVAVAPTEHTLEGLVAGLEEYFREK